MNSFQQLIDDFLENQDIMPTSRRAYASWLRPFHLWVVNNSIKVMEITRPQILAYKTYLKQTVSEKTINCYLTAIRMFYGWCVSNGHLKYNPTSGLRLVRLDKRYSKRPLTPQQTKALLDSCDMNTATGRRAYLIIHLMLVLALRAVEVSRLEVKDIEGRHIRIQRKGRLSKNQTMPITSELLADIRQFAGERFIIETVHGKEMRPQYITAILEGQMIKAGIKSRNISGHSLRHTAAINAMIQCGNDVYEVQKFLGHTSIKTTEIYIRTLMEEDKQTHTIVHRLQERLTELKKSGNNGQ